MDAGRADQRAAQAGAAPGTDCTAAHPPEEPGARDFAPQPVPGCPAADLFGIKGRRWLAEQDLPTDEQAAATALLWQLDFQAQELALIDKDLGQAVIFEAALGNFAP